MAQDVVFVRGLDEFMGVVGGAAAGDILIEVMSADKARALVTRRDPLDEVETGQIQPAVVVAVDMLVDEKDRVAHVGGLAEDNEELLVSAFFDVAP